MFGSGLKALLNDLARFDSKWFNIGVLLMVPVNELKEIPVKSNEILCLQNVLIRWLSLTPTPMKSDLVKMLQSNAIDDHTLARVLQRDPGMTLILLCTLHTCTLNECGYEGCVQQDVLA